MELFYEPQYDAENLFFILYTSFYDDNVDHFVWRRDSDVCSWTHNQCIQQCLHLLNSMQLDNKMKIDLIDSLEYPESVKNAVTELKALIAE